MPFAAIMVHFDASPSSHQRLRLAVDLAIRFEAALIGIAGRLYLPPFLAHAAPAMPNDRTASRRR
jgi:nucleotide-binding universal stress UspA family protein